MLQLAREVCGAQAGKLRDALSRLLQQPDEEAVHDVRVACRRLRVALDIARKLFIGRHVSHLRDNFKELLTMLGGTRDMEVLAARAAQRPPSEHTTAFVQRLAAQVDQHRRASVEAVKSGSFAVLPQQIEELLARGVARSGRARKRQSVSACERVTRVLAKHAKTLRGYAGLAGTAPPETLHALRIEMKKLRYTAEFFSHALPAPPPSVKAASSSRPARRTAQHPLKGLIRTAESYQQLLGDLHDAVVAQAVLGQWLRTGLPWAEAQAMDPATADALRGLLGAARVDEMRLRREFGALWRKQRFRF